MNMVRQAARTAWFRWGSLNSPNCSALWHLFASNAAKAWRRYWLRGQDLFKDDPVNVRGVKDLLGQATFGITEKHYIMGQSRLAGRALAQAVDAARK
jgi:hypothetical protein